MRVILNKDIANLGEEGDIKTVSNGYARNYLLPRKFVMPYTKQNLLILEKRKDIIENKKIEKRKDAVGIKEQLEATQLEFSMPAGANGKLFGSVNAAIIADALEAKGFTIEKKRIEIPDHSIRMVGEFEVKVKLYEQKEALVKVVVANQEDAPKEQ
ncbi:MAG: 50S ribosomal protein L9 [Spirochaetales bacterium]|nr:50S ribosomal protein L9 [Spirochaetales bacterium]